MTTTKGIIKYNDHIGYWNGKTYNGTIYINPSADGTKKTVAWNKSIKIDNADINLIQLYQVSNFSKSNNKPCPICGTYCYGDCQA